MIVANNITHYYGKESALNNVTINISTGQFVCLVGESGSGKSTLLSILSTLLQPSQGELKLLGKDINEIRDIDTFRRNNIGFIFQFHYLIQYLTVKENIKLAVNDNRHHKIEHLLEYLNIKEIEHKYPNQISGGQRQRAAIARALANSPKIIFADEPTGNLDSKNSKKVFELLRNLADDGVTVVVATHDQKLALMADKIYEVEDGKLCSNS